MSTYTRPAHGAIALGVLCFIGTAGFLLHDIHRTGPTLEHGLAVIVLIVAIGAGVMAVDAVRDWRLIEGSAAALIALLASYYCISSAAGRSAEVTATRAGSAIAINDQRARLQQAYDDAKKLHDALLAKLTDACKGGDGGNCKGQKAAIAAAGTTLEKAEAALAAAPPAQPVNAKLGNLAAIAALVAGVDEASALKLLKLLDPNTVAIILELGDIFFWHVGMTRLAHRRRTRIVAGGRMSAAQLQVTSENSTPPPADHAPAPTLPAPATAERQSPGATNVIEHPSARRQRERLETVAAYNAAFRAQHGREPSATEIHMGTGLPRTTAWRLAKVAV